jgi:hypothetical protein
MSVDGSREEVHAAARAAPRFLQRLSAHTRTRFSLAAALRVLRGSVSDTLC